MTIIVYDKLDDVVYVDSGHNFTNGRSQVIATKIATIAVDGGDAKVAISGPGLECAMLERAFPQLARGETVDVSESFTAEGVARLPNGDVRFVCTHQGKAFLCAIEMGPYFATGSGASWFDAYVASGRSTADAVDMVAELHAECALPIETF